jgi:hypothetical protein
VVGRLPSQLRTYCHIDLEMSRLRSTWLAVHLAAGIPTHTLCAAAGIRTIKTFEDLLPHLPAPDEATARAALRGAR